ncbi:MULTISPECIES: M23 family metallopeptidase [unclassified Thioalkalivibrio]|uniref:M23 family metallopeptidase n=1 Tax=unclassified Thioalkalivibrio TaxID=2621013 RepID=UPI00039E2E2D|nr:MULTISPECIES: M23 family metallopeptidase [unclassified Thioalkalivibrio]
MQLIVLRPDGLCARLPLWGMALAGAVLVLLMAVAVVAAYFAGQSQREVVRIPVTSTLDPVAVETAEREAAREGLNHLVERVVTLERQLSRVDRRIRSVGDSLGLDVADLAPASGGQGGPLLEDPDSPLEMHDRLLALEHLLRRHSAAVETVDTELRLDAAREALLPRQRPVEEDSWISSAFGYREDPFTGNRRFHSGMDFAGRPGSEIRAAGGGLVVFAGRRGSFGNLVEIAHGGGLNTRYAHNAEILVEPGQRVEAGEVIAKMGRTGRATDTHLHYEVVDAGRALNPYQFLPDRD